jgi:hypothetical protein
MPYFIHILLLGSFLAFANSEFPFAKKRPYPSGTKFEQGSNYGWPYCDVGERKETAITWANQSCASQKAKRISNWSVGSEGWANFRECSTDAFGQEICQDNWSCFQDVSATFRCL